MIDNGVSAFFHGHDHQYAYEARDGLVYLSMPQPNSTLNFAYYRESDPYTERVLANPGYLRVTIAPDLATVEYVTSSNSIRSGSTYLHYRTQYPAVTHDLKMAVDPAGGGTTNPSVGAHAYTEGTEVTINAMPNIGYVFDSWSGDCTGGGACQVTMNASKSVTAHFTTVATYVLTTAVSLGGGGTINPAAGVHPYASGTVVAVTATPAAGYAFRSWSGACMGTGASAAMMDAAKTVTANFTQITYNLTVAVGPAGGGTTNPMAGIYAYAYGTVVPVAATPADGYVFSSWSGACTGGGACAVTMDAAKTITANFAAEPTSKLGGVNGDGVVNSTDALIILSADVGINASHTVR